MTPTPESEPPIFVMGVGILSRWGLQWITYIISVVGNRKNSQGAYHCKEYLPALTEISSPDGSGHDVINEGLYSQTTAERRMGPF